MAEIDFGQDAPDLLRNFRLAGCGAALVALGLAALGWGPWWLAAAAVLGFVAAYFLGLARFMVTESRSGKVRDRDSILDMLTWRGDERVLDLGCGRGLMMLGAAAKAGTGHVVGIDVWRAEDQAFNSPGATLANARLAGVADRVEVVTGDMRDLPFADASFDIVLSAWAVHNIDDADQRLRALAEAARVLRPGGWLALTDIALRQDYADALPGLGFEQVRIVVLHPVRDRVLRLLTFESFAPATVLARRV